MKISTVIGVDDCFPFDSQCGPVEGNPFGWRDDKAAALPPSDNSISL